MLVLFETPAGYAIFKLLDERKLKRTENLYRAFETPERAATVVRLQHFEKFLDTSEALAATTATVEGKLSKKLKKVLKRHIDKDLQEKLLVADPKLGSAIKSKLDVPCLANTAVQELMRCIRSQLDSLIAELPKREMTAMTLGLAHSLSRYKLKFSPDKIDTMIVQAISLLGDLDKEINNYVMRLREWYGWHFPELGKIVPDHITYAKVIKIIGTKDHTSAADLSDILPEEIEEQVKEAAEISMGSEISDYDILMIQRLCDEIIENINYRASLYAYIQGRMMAIAPNVTVLVGELVGARLMAHAGSLMNLAKRAASTIQILGAEKALFRALKTNRSTPKYGLIYHSELVGRCRDKFKGKMSRMLAAKVALATRVDALGEDGTFTLGTDHRAKLETRLRILETQQDTRISGTGRARAKFEKYHGSSQVRQYPVAADSTLPSTSGTSQSSGKRKKFEESETPKQKKKKLKRELEEAGPSGVIAGPSGIKVEVKAGPSGVKSKRHSEGKARHAGEKVEEVKAGPPGVKLKRHSGGKARHAGEKVEEVKAGPSGVKSKRHSGGKERRVEEKLEEAKAEPSGVKSRHSVEKVRHAGVKVKEVKVGPSGVKPKHSGKKARLSGVKVKDSDSSAKKKKDKQKLDRSAETEVIEAEAEEPTLSKKKKKKIKQELEESRVKAEELEQPTSSKKKKVKQELEGSQVKVEQVEQPTSPKKKKKDKQKLDRSAEREVIEAEAEEPMSSKKTKKVRRALEMEAESMEIPEQETPSTPSKKKKKKARLELETEVLESESTPGYLSATTSPKKKKKKVKHEPQMEVVEPESTPYQSPSTSSKKKKKKMRQGLETEASEPESTPVHQSASLKKKKLKQQLDESETYASAVESEGPTSSKKKKQKKLRQETGETSVTESETPTSEKKQKKKKKKHYDSDDE